MVASSDYASASIINRNQSTGGGFHINSNFFSASYPFLSSKGKRWSGLGVALMDDRAGQGLYSSQEVSVSYGLTLPVSSGTWVSFAVKGLHARRKIDVDGLHTGMQYIPGRGFNEGADNGENFGRYTRAFNTFSAGFLWRKENRKRMPVFTAGLSFFDFNKPKENFLDESFSYSSTAVGSLSYLILTRKKTSVYPEFLVTLTGGTLEYNAGLVTSYELKSYRKAPSDRVDIITKYRSHEGAVIGCQLHKENFSVGLSYDLPVSKRVSNHGAVEVGLALRKLMVPRKASKRKKASEAKNPVTPRTNVRATSDSVKRTPAPKENTPSLSERLKARQDSIIATGVPGQISHEQMILEKASLHFNFMFNSSELDVEAREYLDDVATALRDNPELVLDLIGHTDNVGSPKFNLRLSIQRAETIRQYLISEGVEAERIKAEGRGLAEPLNGNATDEERALNRRVEMKILYSR